MGGGFLREYEIGQEDYGGGGNGEYDYGDDYGYDEYGEGEYAAGGEYGDGVDYGDDYGGQGGETKLPEKEDYDYVREKKRRRRRRRRQASTNELPTEDYDYSVSEKGGALQTNKTWLFNGNTWEERTPMSIPRDRPACSIINMPDGEVSVHVLADNIRLVSKDKLKL